MNKKATPLGELWCYAYRSKRAGHMTRADLAALLRLARMHNVNEDLTGILLLVGDEYIQYLEGPKAAVRAMKDRVTADPRHHAVRTLQDGPITERLFASWALAFQEFNGEALREHAVRGLLDRLTLAVPEGTAPADGHHEVLRRFWADCAASVPN